MTVASELERARLLNNPALGISQPASLPFSADADLTAAPDSASNLARRLLEGSNAPYFPSGHSTASSLYPNLGSFAHPGLIPRGNRTSLDLLSDNSTSSSAALSQAAEALHQYQQLEQQQQQLSIYDQFLGPDRRGPPPTRGFEDF